MLKTPKGFSEALVLLVNAPQLEGVIELVDFGYFDAAVSISLSACSAVSK